MRSNSLLLTCDVLFRFLPFFLDTGIQIWNAVEVNRLATSCEATRYGELEEGIKIKSTVFFMWNCLASLLIPL